MCSVTRSDAGRAGNLEALGVSGYVPVEKVVGFSAFELVAHTRILGFASMGETHRTCPSPPDHGRAMAEVFEVLADIETAIAHAQQARKRLWNSRDENDLEFALDEAVSMLQIVTARLHDDIAIAISDNDIRTLALGNIWTMRSYTMV